MAETHTSSIFPLLNRMGKFYEYNHEKPTFKIAKYVTITILAIAAIALISTSLVGIASLVGGALPHTFLGALNTPLTSAWGGLPTFMTAAGSPGYLLALGLLIYGVYVCAKKIKMKKEMESSIGKSHESYFNVGDFRTKSHTYKPHKNTACYIYKGEEAEAFFNDPATISVMHENKIISFYQPEGEAHVVLYWTSAQDRLETATFQSRSALRAKTLELLNKGNYLVSVQWGQIAGASTLG